MYIFNQCGVRTDLAVSFVLALLSRRNFYFLLSSSFSFLHPFLGAFAKLRKATIMLIKRSNLTQQCADIYLLQSHSTCFGRHSTHHQEH